MSWYCNLRKRERKMCVLPHRGSWLSDVRASPGSGGFLLEKLIILVIFLPAARLTVPVSSDSAPRLGLPVNMHLMVQWNNVKRCVVYRHTICRNWVKANKDFTGPNDDNHKQSTSCIKTSCLLIEHLWRCSGGKGWIMCVCEREREWGRERETFLHLEEIVSFLPR